MKKIIIALISVIIYIILSIIIPCLYLKNRKPLRNPLILNINNIFENNKRHLMLSSLIFGLIVYSAVCISDQINIDNYINNNNNNYNDNINVHDLFSLDRKPNIKNLVKLY